MHQLFLFAGAHERFLAHMIDNIGMFVVASVLVTIMQADHGMQMLLGFLTGLFYYSYFQAGKWQASPGMRVVGIRLVQLGAAAGKVSARDAAARYLAFMGPLYPMYVSFLEDGARLSLVVWLGIIWYGSMLIRPDRAAVHDLLCNMRVVRGKTEV